LTKCHVSCDTLNDKPVNLLKYTVDCRGVQINTVDCSGIQSNTVDCSGVQRITVNCRGVPRNTVIQIQKRSRDQIQLKRYHDDANFGKFFFIKFKFKNFFIILKKNNCNNCRSLFKRLFWIYRIFKKQMQIYIYLYI